MQVFVYGTLREGFGNNHLMAPIWKLGECWVDGFEMRSCGGFPAIVPKEGSRVFGEVFVLNKVAARRVDRLEGYPEWYDRQEVQTPYGRSWAYMFTPEQAEGLKVVECGDWKAYSEARR